MAFGKVGFEEVKRKLGKATVPPDRQKETLRKLRYLCEKLCEHARNVTPCRDSGGYDDQTGNLRSSIGYRLYKDGEAVGQGGLRNVSGGNGQGAAKEALDKYERMTPVSNDGWEIRIVAGMAYAAYVEAKGYNVLHLTGVEMRKEIERMKEEM